jgi:molybdate transport system ATP-binding protein
MSLPKPERSRRFLSLEKATFRLGDRLVFPDTTWTFNNDEHWAILGPNGSGKSLFADALRGRVPLVGGELSYHFRPPLGLSAEETIGHVSFEERKAEVHERVVQSRWTSFEQEAASGVRDFLSYERVMEVNPYEIRAGRLRARQQFGRRLRRAVSLLRLEPFLGRTMLSLSNGETQRVQLARALCHPLRLLILDEPFAGLDAARRTDFSRVLGRLMETAVRVVIVTTRAEDLPRYITHVMRVEDCRVVAAKRREEVLRRRSLRLVAGASGCHPARVRADPNPPRTRRGATAPELVRLRQVTVRYGGAVILDRLNWTVREGESWALLGPNGSGKTTVLSLILGDHPQAYNNEVEVFGQRRGRGESIWDLKRRIGWVAPELHVHFDDALSCFDVVASGFRDTIGLFEPPSSRERAAVRRWLARFELLEYAERPLFSVSAGLQRMVLLARALVKGPRLLILDEPCQGLDAAHRRLFVGTVDALVRAGSVTAIYVTHRSDEIPHAIHRVLRLGGRQPRLDTEPHSRGEAAARKRARSRWGH